MCVLKNTIKYRCIALRNVLYLVARVPRWDVGHPVSLPVDVRHRDRVLSPRRSPGRSWGPSWWGTALRVDSLGTTR